MDHPYDSVGCGHRPSAQSLRHGHNRTPSWRVRLRPCCRIRGRVVVGSATDGGLALRARDGRRLAACELERQLARWVGCGGPRPTSHRRAAQARRMRAPRRQPPRGARSTLSPRPLPGAASNVPRRDQRRIQGVFGLRGTGASRADHRRPCRSAGQRRAQCRVVGATCHADRRTAKCWRETRCTTTR